MRDISVRPFDQVQPGDCHELKQARSSSIWDSVQAA